MKISKYILLLLLSLPISRWSQSAVNDSVVNSLFDKYEFYISNNHIDKDYKLPARLNNTLEESYLKSLLLFKQNRFTECYNLLSNRLKDNPQRFQFYDLLAKTAGITGNVEILRNRIAAQSNASILYLKGVLDYNKPDYKSAVDFFLKALKLKSNSFDILYYLAYSYRGLGDYDEALNNYYKASDLTNKNSPDYTKVLVAIGSLYYLSGDYNKAKEFYTSGLQSAEKTGNKTEQIKANFNLAMINDEEGETGKANKLFEDCVKTAGDIDNIELKALCLSELAVSFTYSNDLLTARIKYLESYSIFRKLNNISRMALTANNIGNLFLSIGNYQSSLEYYSKALSLAGDNVRTRMLALRGLGDTYTNLSDFAKAIDYYNSAKQLAGKIKDLSSVVEINNGAAVLYYNLNHPEKALNILKEKADYINDSDSPYLKAETYQKIGIVYSTIDSLDVAKIYLEKSALISEKYDDIYNRILSQTFLSYLDIKTRNFPSARKSLNKLIKLSDEYSLWQLLSLQYLFKAETEDSSSEKNIIYLEKAAEYAQKGNDNLSLIEAYYKSGKYYESKNKFQLAENYYKKSIALVDENLPVLYRQSDLQIKFFSNYFDIYNSLINLYIRNGQIEKAFIYNDKARSRNTMYNLINLKLGNNSKNLLDKYYDLRWKLNQKLVTENEKADLLKDLNSTKEKLIATDNSLKNILEVNTNYTERFSTDKLNKNQYFISYFVYPEYTYAFVVSGNNLSGIKLQTDKQRLYELVSAISPYYNNKFFEKELSFNKDLFAFNSKAANNMYLQIVKPVIKNIPINSELIFSLPVGLAALPFELLVTNSDSETNPYYLNDKKFFINDYAISYAPSLQIFNELMQNPLSTNKDILLIGNPNFTPGSNFAEQRGINEELDIYSRNMTLAPLKYSGEEISGINNLFNHTVVLMNDKATETNFKNYSESSSIIHLSTHSFLFKKNPVIVFSNSDQHNDGFLETGEIVGMHLKADMVVLSSCKSGLGSSDKAEGILGMQKAFFDAGASSIVVSLWDVSDNYTAKLMSYFYEYLSNGFDKSAALRLAKEKFRQNDNPNPYYWAAFVLSGNTSRVNLSEADKGMSLFLYILLILVSVVFLVYLYLKKKYNFRISL